MRCRMCPDCGACLDPNEICDCQEEKEKCRPGAANTGKRQGYELMGIVTPDGGKINA